MITIKRYGGYKDGRLLRFGSKVKSGIKVSLKEAATNVRNVAKNIVAVKTGRLQRSLRLTTASKDAFFVGTTVPYAGYLEFGTINQSAQPYFRPAVAATEKIMGKKINAQLIKAWNGA